ncbi:MAG: metal-sensing transcriptional repressor [Selenomonadaceae bacterium]|nr:metal-sensing transcriptional repressor [Selenomonadaceae bacterium]
MHEHEHTLDDGTVIRHSHTHTQTKAVLNRMARLIGHLQSTKKMIEDGRDCSEVLIQLSAVDAAIKAVQRIILKDHLEHCIVDAIKEGDTAALERLNKAVEQFIR